MFSSYERSSKRAKLMLAYALRESEESEKWRNLASEQGKPWNYKYYYYYKTKIHDTFLNFDSQRNFRAMKNLLDSECGDFIRFHVSLCNSQTMNFQENDEIKRLMSDRPKESTSSGSRS